MLWDFYCPACDRTTEHWVANRDDKIVCEKPGHKVTMTRCPGGKKMLYFEEGRARTHWSMSDKPITSYAQQKRLMKEHGLVEAGAGVPPRLAKRGAVKPEMKEQMARQKGRWI